MLGCAQLSPTPSGTTMKMNRSLRLVVVVVVAVVAVWIARSGQDAPPVTSDQNIETAAPAAQSGMIAHIDPVTGEPVETPPPAMAAEAGKDGSDAIYVEEPSPGGGVMVQLNGGFQHSAVATVGDSDSVTIECVPEAHAPNGNDAKQSHPDGGN